MGTRWSSSFLALNYLAMPLTEAIPNTSLEAHGTAAGHQCSERHQTAPETFGVDAAGAEPLCWPSSSREFTLPLRSHGRSILLPHFSFLFPLPQRKGVVPDTSLNLFSHQSEQHSCPAPGLEAVATKKIKKRDCSRASTPCGSLGVARSRLLQARKLLPFCHREYTSPCAPVPRSATPITSAQVAA